MPGETSPARTNGSESTTHASIRNARRLWSWFPNPEYTLENSGSVARDHLANERTWLAYLRTSLAVASTGVALVQLFTISAANEEGDPDYAHHDIHRFARPLGATTVALGIMVLVIGAYRYFRIQYALTLGRFPPARKTMAMINGLLIGLVAVIFGILVGLRQ